MVTVVSVEMSLYAKLVITFGITCVLSHYLFIFTDASIVQGPVNHTVPIGTITTFHCTARGEHVYWEINDRAINDHDAEYDPSTSTYSITINITALPQSNNTNITCVTRSNRHYSISLPAKLTVIGTYTV